VEFPPPRNPETPSLHSPTLQKTLRPSPYKLEPQIGSQTLHRTAHIQPAQTGIPLAAAGAGARSQAFRTRGECEGRRALKIVCVYSVCVSGNGEVHS